jgi:hypothetical protein
MRDGVHVHPSLAAGGLQLLSWNVNGPVGALDDASLYRPRFVALPWPPPPQDGDGDGGGGRG